MYIVVAEQILTRPCRYPLNCRECKVLGNRSQASEAQHLRVTVLPGADVQDIRFTIYNRNKLTEHTVIGTAEYPLAQAISTGFEESRVPVTTPEGNVKGSLHIRAIFHSQYTHK